jgi:Flp pilus assembly protein TadG
MNLVRRQFGRICRNKGDRRGAVIVEFALTAPILFLFLFASLEFSRYIMIQQTATSAAYEAARQCILPGFSATDGKNAGKSILTQAGLRYDDATAVVIYDATIKDPPAAPTEIADVTSPIPNTVEKVKATVSVPVARNLWVQSLYSHYLGSGTITKSCTLTCDWVNTSDE